MKHLRITAIVVITLAVQVLAGPSLVQADNWPAPDQPNEPVGTEFTYQGYLTEGGAPAEGVFDFEINLFNAAEGGDSADTLLYDNVPVVDGYFTVLLDYNVEMSLGEARWLEIGVRPGAETGAYTTLEPRQALTATPFAMSTPWMGLSGIPAGFRDGIDNDTTYTAGTGLSLTDTSFSLNFGGTGTSTTASHSDHIHTTYWRVNGNSQTDPATNFIGTMDNVDLVFRVNNQPVLRLEPSSVSPNLIGGIAGNNVNAGVFGATIGGGGTSSLPNQVTWDMGTVGGGLGNTTSGYGATVAGGYSNTASGWGSTVPGGYEAEAREYGQMAYASGSFDYNGDAQASLYVLRNISEGYAWTNLFLNGTNDYLNLTTGHIMTFDILIVSGTYGGESAGYRIQGIIENFSGTTALIGTPTITVLGEDDSSWDVQVAADNTNDALSVQVKGNGEVIHWVANVQTAEINWP